MAGLVQALVKFPGILLVIYLIIHKQNFKIVHSIMKHL